MVERLPTTVVAASQAANFLREMDPDQLDALAYLLVQEERTTFDMLNAAMVKAWNHAQREKPPGTHEPIPDAGLHL